MGRRAAAAFGRGRGASRQAERRRIAVKLATTSTGGRAVRSDGDRARVLFAAIEASDLSPHPGQWLERCWPCRAQCGGTWLCSTHPRSLIEPEVAAGARAGCGDGLGRDTAFRGRGRFQARARAGGAAAAGCRSCWLVAGSSRSRRRPFCQRALAATWARAVASVEGRARADRISIFLRPARRLGAVREGNSLAQSFTSTRVANGSWLPGSIGSYSRAGSTGTAWNICRCRWMTESRLSWSET